MIRLFLLVFLPLTILSGEHCHQEQVNKDLERFVIEVSETFCVHYGPLKLHQMCHDGNYETITTLRDCDFCPINTQDDQFKETPLHIAIRMGASSKIIQLLLNKGADSRIENWMGYDAFDLVWRVADRDDKAEVTRMLLLSADLKK